MPDFDLVDATPPTEAQPYPVACCKCTLPFDAMAARWCSCAAKLRTLRCAHCGSCFCQAPYLYRSNFWKGAPKALREHLSRFCIAAPAEETGMPAVAAHSSRPAHVPHVLIVDDEEPIRSLAACYVEQLGYEVTTVDNPEEALLMADAIAYDVVLTDALMPKMDGRELCRRLKQAHGDDFKVILMTSLYTARHFRTEARHVFKVDDHLAKPLRYAELRDALQRVAPIAGTRRQVMV